MATPINNPLVKLFKSLVIWLLFILVVEVAWFGIGHKLLAANSSVAIFDYNIEAPEIAKIAAAETFREAVSRSLFNWNRQPKAANQQLVNQEGLSSRWRLTGVVNTGNATYAIFSEISGDRRLRLEQGMYLEKWKIGSITDERVLLNNSDEEDEVFYLKETSNTETAPKRKGARKKPEKKAVD